MVVSKHTSSCRGRFCPTEGDASMSIAAAALLCGGGNGADVGGMGDGNDADVEGVLVGGMSAVGLKQSEAPICDVDHHDVSPPQV